MDKLQEAQEQFDIALNHFNYADKENIEVAISNLNTALDNLNLVRAELNMPLYEL